MSDTISFRPPDFSDAGNANRLAIEYHGLLAFADALGWLWWNGKKWERNEHKAVDKAVKLTENMTMEAMAELSEAIHAEADAAKAIPGHCKRAGGCSEPL